jgi:hypothetical protein
LREFFVLWARAVLPAMRPGAHVFIASNAFVSQLAFSALVEGGLKFRVNFDGYLDTGLFLDFTDDSLFDRLVWLNKPPWHLPVAAATS